MDQKAVQQKLSDLPSVHTLLQYPEINHLTTKFARSYVVNEIRAVLQGIRTRILSSSDLSSVEMDEATVVRMVVTQITASTTNRQNLSTSRAP